jgi:hypothetical protein
MSILKLCSVCKQQKPVDEFGPERRKKSGKKYLCRDCESERQRVRYHNVLTEEQRNARRQAASLRAQQRWADKKERGECTNCSQPAVAGHIKCEFHLREAAERGAARRKELDRIGVCTRCGQRPQAVGMRYCNECLVVAPRNRRWAKAPVHRKTYRRERQQEIKNACFAAYGGFRCNCCGESQTKFLTIDHMNNDGAIHRRTINGVHGRSQIYRWLRRHGYPEGFQVLCFNCNSGRQLNGGICPHQEKLDHPLDAMLSRFEFKGEVH